MTQLKNIKVWNHKDKRDIWLTLMIGTSRLHWAWFVGEYFQESWDTPHASFSVKEKLANCRTLSDLPEEMLPPCWQPFSPARTCTPTLPAPPIPPLYLASVVPSQAALWQTYPNIHVVTLDHVPLQGVYPTLGIDRALGLWGAGETWGWPMLVIDAGTALTLTAANTNRCLVGGAILPGVSLQLKSLAQKAANLPFVDRDAISLPSRWALNTPEAIQSGIIYTLVAGMQDFIQAWWQEFPESYVTLTGGDRTLLFTHMQLQFPETAVRVITDRHLIFWGIRSCKQE